MTDLEKRVALDNFCENMMCDDCILQYNCRCGRGTHFLRKTNDKFDMTEEEISKAYQLVFSEQSESDEENISGDLLVAEVEPDTLIAISIQGKRKVSNIEIYFKED